MAFQKHVTTGDAPPINIKSLSFTSKENGKASLAVSQRRQMESHLDIDLKEVYFLIMHFLSAGPCLRTYGQLWNELLEHQLLPRRYHAWYSRNGSQSRDENDNGMSFPLSYNNLVERHPHVGQDHLIKLLKQLMMLDASAPSKGVIGGNVFNAANVPTLLGTGCFSLLANGQNKGIDKDKLPLAYTCWPHRKADQLRGLRLREIGGGFARHHRAPSTRAACHAIIKPSTLVQKMQNIKRVRGHRNAVYCAIFDRAGRYVVTGSDDRLVKIWSMETAYCLASCRGHEGDITDLAVNFNNTLVASASNDCVIRVWRLPDGMPISILRGHTGAVTAIAFSPRSSAPYQLLSSSDDGSCRIWDARYSHFSPRIYVPKPSDSIIGRNIVSSSSTTQQSHQIFCCAFNASGTFFVTGSSDTFARVWNAFKSSSDDSEQPNHEIDILAGHENDVNYVQFSGCAVTARFSFSDASKEDTVPKFKNSWFNHDNIVTCSRDGSAIIWIPRSRKSHGKTGRWIRAYHLKVPPPPMPPQPPRGGPRQRILPTPRGVNMIAWSLDNRFVLAAIMGNQKTSHVKFNIASLLNCCPQSKIIAMETFQKDSVQEDAADDYSPLWKFVTKIEKGAGGGNVTWSCNICTKVCKGSYSRVKAHLLQLKGFGIASCVAVSLDQKKHMQKLLDEAELRRKNAKPKEVKLPSSSGSINIASKSSSSSPFSSQSDDPTKKRKGTLGPLEKAFNLNARDELHSEIARLFYTGGLSFNIARNPHYIRAFSMATQRTIPGYLPPGYNLLRTTLLQREKAHIEKLLEPTKAAWKQKGVSICSDGWSDVQRRPLINIMVVCESGPMFLKAINCEGEYKDKVFISKLLIDAINELGHQNVVQVVTDNAPVCKAAGLLVEAKYPHIFWTPCVVHTLNLALKNICAPIDSLQNKEFFEECKWIAEISNDASMIKNFIMNHNMRFSTFNDKSNMKMLLLAETRFASTIIMLKRFKQIKKCLENMVISER